MRKHALHLYLEELETMDSTFSGGHLPGDRNGCGSPLRVGITETAGKERAHRLYPALCLPAPSEVAHFYPACLRLAILKTMSYKRAQF